MITRAIIEEKINEYEYRVRIPIFDRAANTSLSTATKDLCIAVASLPKGVYNSLQKDDVVFVGFENNEVDSPIILGQLYREALRDLNTQPTVSFDNLEVNNQVVLPTNINIGELNYGELFNLKNSTENIQDQLNSLKEKINNLQQFVAKLHSGD